MNSGKETVGKAADLVGDVVARKFASRDVFGDGPKLTVIKQNPDLQDCWFHQLDPHGRLVVADAAMLKGCPLYIEQ